MHLPLSGSSACRILQGKARQQELFAQIQMQMSKQLDKRTLFAKINACIAPVQGDISGIHAPSRAAIPVE